MEFHLLTTRLPANVQHGDVLGRESANEDVEKFPIASISKSVPLTLPLFMPIQHTLFSMRHPSPVS